jgi:hypothetical protein
MRLHVHDYARVERTGGVFSGEWAHRNLARTLLAPGMIVYLGSSVRIQVLDDSSRALRCLDAGTRFESIVGYVVEAIHSCGTHRWVF